MELKVTIERLELSLEEIKFWNTITIVGYVTYPLVVGYFILKRAKKELALRFKRKEKIITSLKIIVKNQVGIVSREWNKKVKADTYIIHSAKELFEVSILDVFNELVYLGKQEKVLPEDLIELIYKSKIELQEIKKSLFKYNDEFVARRKKEYSKLFKKPGYELDDDQQTAVIVDDKHNLVVAGAGSGKTDVLIHRIAYLAKRKPDTVKPHRILALAFQNKAAEQIKKRLSNKRLNVKTVSPSDIKTGTHKKGYVTVGTFHSLGKKILRASSGGVMKETPQLIFDGDNYKKLYERHINLLFEALLKKKETKTLVVNFMKSYGDDFVIKDRTDFETKEEFHKYMQGLKYTALDGQIVDSVPEREILNFFVINNVNGKQLKLLHALPADWMKYTKDGETNIPNPDFFIGEHNIYWEHWAVTEKGNVPYWFEGNTQTERNGKYFDGMDAKKEKFEEQIKCYSDYKDLSKYTTKYELIETTNADVRKNFQKIIQEKILFALEKRHPEEEFVIEELPYEELVKRVWYNCKTSVSALSSHIANFITIAKTYDLNSKQIEIIINKDDWTPKQISFANIAVRVFELYEQELRSKNKIDFCDMINLAIKELKKNKDFYEDTYDHILIDEFQDLSTQRFNLVNELMKKNSKCKLFCVGDDWQSIMGFSGADLDYFVKFGKFFDNPAETKLEVNYRSNKSIVELGNDIIKHNDEKSQIQKKTVAENSDEVQVTLFSSQHQGDYKRQYLEQVAKHCVDKIKELHEEGVAWEDMMILRRIINNPQLINPLKEYAKEQEVPITRNPDRQPGVPLMSVHQSKGLQAKIVFVLNVDKDLYGFPCELENPDIYEPAKLSEKKDRLEEERRLFYVAVTRGREQVFLYDQSCSESQFIKEIRSKLNIEYLPY
ncbi:MAG: UvrD-helicase domain-containing protein [archaeon]